MGSKGVCEKCGKVLDVAFGLNRWFCVDCAMTAYIDASIALKQANKHELADLNFLAKRCYTIAEQNGFFEFEKSLVNKYNFDKEELKKIEMVFLSQIISHATSEHSELYEALRNNQTADIEQFLKFDLEDSDKFYMAFKELIKNTFQSELCDAITILLGLAYKLGIDLDKQIEWNLKFNQLRFKKEGVCNGKNF